MNDDKLHYINKLIKVNEMAGMHQRFEEEEDIDFRHRCL